MQAKVFEVSNAQQMMPVQVKATAVAGLACLSEPFYNHGQAKPKALVYPVRQVLRQKTSPLKIVTNIILATSNLGKTQRLLHHQLVVRRLAGLCERPHSSLRLLTLSTL